MQGEKLIERVKKLLALASSSNSHESALATAKANEILLKYNLQTLNERHDDDEEICVKKTVSAKKRNGKLEAIYEILTSFFVCPVFNRGRGQCYLEIVGSRTNVELADYVAGFLDHELERLWKLAQKENPSLKGMAKKNSFMRALGKSYGEKTKDVQKGSGKDLIPLQKNLARQVELVFPRLGGVSSQGQFHADSAAAGAKHGKSLSINPGLKNSQGKRLLLTKE